MSSTTEAQAQRILAILKTGRSITSRDALHEVGSFRLAARIYDLRQAGYDIATVVERDGDRHWARYVLMSERQAA